MNILYASTLSLSRSPSPKSSTCTAGVKPWKSQWQTLAELLRLSSTCNSGNFSMTSFATIWLCGLRKEIVQKRLLAEANLTFGGALEIARGKEAIDKNAKVLQGSETAAVRKVSAKRLQSKSETCHRCGRTL